jgi:hypothetical protein
MRNKAESVPFANLLKIKWLPVGDLFAGKKITT